jgi:hypothetical protein
MRARNLLLIAAGAVALGGCAYDDYGYGYGFDNGYYGYGDRYYAPQYYHGDRYYHRGYYGREYDRDDCCYR